MKKKKKPLRYFFYKGDLHKKLHINRGADLITAWHYRAGKPVKYSYTEVKKNGKRAFSTAEVAKMVKRDHWGILSHISNGHIRPPEMNYSLDENRNTYAYYWNEDNIMELHDYLKTVHIGRPRKDGEITAGRGLPNARELRALIRDNRIYYVENDKGEFVPTWDADRL